MKFFTSKSGFNYNVVTLLKGTVVAQALPILVSPILSRLYTPDDFGVLSLFVSMCLILGPIANARYDFALLLPEKEDEVKNLFCLTQVINILIFVCLFIVAILWSEDIALFLDNRGLKKWIIAVPFVVFFIGIFNSLNLWNTRNRKFSNISSTNVFKSITLVCIQLVFAFLSKGPIGLISGYLSSNVLGSLFFVKKSNIKSYLTKGDDISFKQIKEIAKKYSNFPKFSMPAILSFTLSQHFLNILISAFYNVTTLGYYSFLTKILGLPFGLIGNSISQVFMEESKREISQTGSSIITFKNTLKKLVIIGLPLFSILFFIVEDLFSFVFGSNWAIAGHYAKFIMPLFFFRFVISTLSTTTIVFDKEKISLVFQTFILAINFTLIYLSKVYNIEFSMFLTSITISNCILLLILFAAIYKLAKGAKT